MGKNCAAMNMAIDEAILLSQKAQPCPTLRFYDWTQPAFSFGYFQDIAAAVDVPACRADGIELVKRMTGGGTVVHGWELTYTLILPRISRAAHARLQTSPTGRAAHARLQTSPTGVGNVREMPTAQAYQQIGRLQTSPTGVGNVREMPTARAYQQIGESLVTAMTQLGIPAQRYVDAVDADAPNICLTKPAQHDVMLIGKKVAGVSVRRNRNGMLFQGYISLEMPPMHILASISKCAEVQRLVREKSTALHAAGYAITRDALIQAICETVPLGIAFLSGELSLAEREQAAVLAKTKYATAAWNFR